ncbi:ferredoxin Fer [Halorussus halophilus]|uniref:ferredoxin Fer n=1 Tax=Halorussus halophilus TaxID=2650975 RepID=UPI001300EE10|nr:ferredoxin Fer [Halorussus halophilus]
MDSPFEVLHLDSDADDEQVEQAYRERVKQAHPDQGGSVQEFQRVRRAYEKIKAGYEESADLPDAEPDTTDDQTTPEKRAYSEVTYLNYDVLPDYGWEIGDDALFEKAADKDLPETDYGTFEVEPGESLLEAAEDRGYEWPFACRGGACANCAIMLFDGELSMPSSHVLPAEMMAENIRLSCNGMPITDELQVVYNVKHMPELDDLLLPPKPFEQAYSDD